MRSFLSFLAAIGFLSAIIAGALQAQQNQKVVIGSDITPLDTRPIGKYLASACVLRGNACVSLAVASNNRPAQTITVKQVGCAPGTTPCSAPVYPLSMGDSFFVSATSDSGLQVTQTVVAGDVTPIPPGAAGTQGYIVNSPGTIVIRATVEPGQLRGDQYAAATPAELVLAPPKGGASDAASCTLLGPPAASQTAARIDLAEIINLIGNPAPFTLVAQGTNTILIYSSRFPLTDSERDVILPTIIARIQDLAAWTPDPFSVPATAKAFKVELEIPHAAALGDLATRISGLNYSQFTVQDIGSNKVRISATSQPDCPTWMAFLTSIREMQWQVTEEPNDLKLYYLNSTDAATAFTTLLGGSSPGGSATPAPASAPSSSGGAPGPAGSATITVNQPPGSFIGLSSDTTACVVAGLSSGNTGACAPASGGASPAASAGGASAPAAPKPPAMAAMNVAAGANEQSFSDLLVFSNAAPGDDAQILERKRILAQLDLPRPEVIVNAWVMQNSTTDPRAIGEFRNAIRDLVEEYNETIEQVVLLGWQFVQGQTALPGFFNPDFYSYIAEHYVADTYAQSTPSGAQDAAQNFLNTSPAQLADAADARTRDFGLCPAGRYCLGYTTLFQPLKPRLTDLLLNLIAANDPVAAAMSAVAVVEGPSAIVEGQPLVMDNERRCDAAAVAGEKPREVRERCRAIWTNLGLDQSSPQNCATTDYEEILASLITNPPDQAHRRPRMYLSCFQQAAATYLRSSAVGLLRAAIADFLYNYKISLQYPHEFTPYDLSQSASALNDALGPIIDAFNRDVVAFQTFMRADVQYKVDRLNEDTDQRCCAKRLFGLDKPSFFNDGLVTVRTISGTTTTVNTTSQSALNVSSAPTLANLASNIGTPAGSSGASPVAGVLGAGAQPGVALLGGVLNSYQTAYAQIGRQLNLTVTPRSLATASSAEINVTLMADETAGGPTYSGGPQGAANPNTSRVANHDVTTRIRVESVKLFEISSLSAIVERSRSKFPLLPPFVEIPYIGTIAGIPIKGAREYHSSIAVMSAMVVPTAADLAYGLRFVADQVVDGDPGKCSYVKGSAGAGVANSCTFRTAVAISDLNKSPIRSFHRSMLSCLATGMRTPYSSTGGIATPPAGACENLTFDSVPRNAF